MITRINEIEFYKTNSTEIRNFITILSLLYPRPCHISFNHWDGRIGYGRIAITQPSSKTCFIGPRIFWIAELLTTNTFKEVKNII
jgi:hypothetical protein